MMILANWGTYKAPLKSVHNAWLSFEQCKLTFMYYFCSRWLWQVEQHDLIIQNIIQLFKNLNLAGILYKNMQIYFTIVKRLTLLSLNYHERLIYLLKIFFAHLFLNLIFFYVKHIITFIPLELFTSFTGLTIL